MVQAEELSQRVLAELEEAGEENIFSMLNTILTPAGADFEVATFKLALTALVHDGLVNLGLVEFGSRAVGELSLQESSSLVDDLDKWFSYDAHRALWTLREGDWRTTKKPKIFLTLAGREKSKEILGRRGYQWWRPSTSQ